MLAGWVHVLTVAGMQTDDLPSARGDPRNERCQTQGGL